MNTQLLLLVISFFSPIWFYFTIASLLFLIKNKIDSKGRLSLFQIKTAYRLAGAVMIVLLSIGLDFYWNIDLVEQASWDGYLHTCLAVSYVSWVFFRYYVVLSYPFEQKKACFCAACHGRGKVLQEVTKTYWWTNGFVVDVEEQTCPECHGSGIAGYTRKGKRYQIPPSLQKQPKELFDMIRNRVKKSKKKVQQPMEHIDWANFNTSISAMAAHHERIAQEARGERILH
ncbi:MAG: hypothetical protein ACPGXL_08890 [Chitinophagales bacterium]